MDVRQIVLVMAGAALLLAAGSKSVWDGVYTEQQAKRGQPLYREHCEDCHGEELEGDAEAPPLSGGEFLINWDGQALGSLYLRIHRDMPLNKDAGRLSPSVSADLLAFILSVNHFPPGRTELPPRAEVLNEIRFESAKPDQKR